MIVVDRAGLSPLPQPCLQHWGTRTGWKHGTVLPIASGSNPKCSKTPGEKSCWLEIVWPFPIVFQPLSFFSLSIPNPLPQWLRNLDRDIPSQGFHYLPWERREYKKLKKFKLPIPLYCVKIFICLNWTYHWMTLMSDTLIWTWLSLLITDMYSYFKEVPLSTNERLN